ncbi:hypothetical protein [Wenyingzhuangia sp. IMCC45574]
MSRSFKKNKIQGITTAKSEKYDKQKANRKFRRVVKEKLGSSSEELPQRRELSNVWSFAKDGKVYRLNMLDKDLRK